MKKYNKRGIELSINFMVVLILAIVIFGFGIRFIYSLSSQAIELKDLTSKELDARVADLLCSSSQKVCIGTDKKIIAKGKFDVFGIKILNVGEAQALEIQIAKPNPSGYTKQNSPIPSSDNSLSAAPAERSESFARNEERKFGIGIDVPATATSGTYIFDVKVLKSDGTPYASTQKLYVEVP